MKLSIIVEVIYRHPSMDLTDFNCSYLNKLLESISKGFIFLFGDFIVNLFSCNEHKQTNEFLDTLASNSFIPLIIECNPPGKGGGLKNIWLWGLDFKS